MKSKIWLWMLPIIGLFSWSFVSYEESLRGEINSPFIQDYVIPFPRWLHGQHTNFKFKSRGAEKAKHKIVIVEIDEDSIMHFKDVYGRWPWRRDGMALLLQSIFDAGAKYVGLDIVFSEPDKRVLPEMATLLKEHKLDDKVQLFETDTALENVIAFNAAQLTLGWAGERECQPLLSQNNPDSCLAMSDDPPARQRPDMKRFALQDIHFETPMDLKRTPLLTISRFLTNMESYVAIAENAGYFSAIPDSDGYIRRTMPVQLAADGNLYPSLTLSMAKKILNDDVKIELNSKHMIERITFKNSGKKIPVTPLGMMSVNFRGPMASFQYVKAMEVMRGSDDIRIEQNRQIASVSKSELLKDSIVLVGVSALAAFDMRHFPFESNVPGVEGHANILDNLLSHDMLSHGDGKNWHLWMLLFMTLGAVLFAVAVERLESVPALVLFAVFLGGGFLLDQKFLFEARLENWNTSLLILEYGAVFLLTIAAKYVLEEKNKKSVRDAFGKYVSPAIVDSVLKDSSKLALGGEKRELTIVFSDIRSFTTFSEKMDAKVLTQFLNDYLGKMTDIVFDTGGTLDKYIGDAVMAFWGAPVEDPKHAANAIRATIQMQQLLAKMRPEYEKKYGIDVRVGIGINTGAVNVGNMGSNRIFEYTVIGDQVNLASRVEGLTKEYFAEILTTRATLDAMKQTGETLPPHRVLDLVKVKGKKQAVELIEILTRPMSEVGLTDFQSGRDLYSQQKWDEAMECFIRSSQKLKIEDRLDEVSLLFIERCKEFKQNPPEPSWDGAWVMSTK